MRIRSVASACAASVLRVLCEDGGVRWEKVVAYSTIKRSTSEVCCPIKLPSVSARK